MEKLPRISSVKATGTTTVEVKWARGTREQIDLAGWIATGGDILAPLRDPEIFRTARRGDFGASVEWAEDDDLAIDALHLSLIAAEQRPLETSELEAWQRSTGWSNEEVANVLGVSRSTWASYKGGTRVPPAVGMIIRTMRRDPLLAHAHFRPLAGKAGRPRRGASA